VTELSSEFEGLRPDEIAREPGVLYLVPNTLGDNEPLEVLPLSVKKTVIELEEFIVENEKTARRFLKKIGLKAPQEKITIHILNKYTEEAERDRFLDGLLTGRDIGLISEAGMPAIADPGSDIVKMAHEQGFQVVPLVGPSSILLGLTASGMNGQNFAFVGYLPIDKADRKKRIKSLERRSREEKQTQIFIETPYRNHKLIDDLLSHLAPTTRLCLAANLTVLGEFVQTHPVKDWRRLGIPDLHKIPCIFLIQS
jgi:16S rRNA (cytidine1402-2'-O)-methyltransferase